MRRASNWGGARINAGRKPAERTKVVRLPVPIADLARRMAGRGFRAGDIAAFIDVEARTTAAVPFVTAEIACGFPSPADDSLENPLDFNELVNAGAPSVFSARVGGESMIGAGILPGDVVVIDRAITPVAGHIILGCLNGEFTLKRLLRPNGQVVLHPENPVFSDIVVAEGDDFQVWGVVTNVVRSL